MDTRACLALDIGGSHLTAAVVSLAQGEVLPESVKRTEVDPSAPAETLLEAFCSALLEAFGRAGERPLEHIGVAMPGPFDYEAGISMMTHKFAALHGMCLRDEISGRLAGWAPPGLAVLFGNDGAVYTLGEWWAGAAKGRSRVLGVTLGTGLGSGFVAGGRIASDEADPAARAELWRLAYRDSVAEEYVSARGIRRLYLEMAGRVASASEIAELARAGDPAAIAAYLELGASLAAVLMPSQANLLPDCIVVGGSIARSWPLFAPPVIRALGGSSAVVPSRLFDLANLLGCAALHDSRVRDHE